MSLSERWAHILDQLRREGRYRSLATSSGVDFTSNDYLGYGSGRLRLGTASTLPRSGTASRLLRGHHPLWDEVESQLARWHGAGAVLMMNSGYVANEGLLATVIEPGDWVASDQFNHASIIDGLRLSRAERCIYAHNDLDQLESGLQEAKRAHVAGRQYFIVTESLFSMEGDCAPLAEMAGLADKYGANLIVDEAHATGCFGATGSGLVDALGLRGRVLATVHTGGKALGVTGAYICGSAPLREILVNRCRPLIFTTALPPVVASWWLEMIPFVQADAAGRYQLHAGATRLRTALAKRGVAIYANHYIVPVLLGDAAGATAVAASLQQAGWDIRPIRPPTVPEGTSRLRIAVHADHDDAVLEEVAGAVAQSIERARDRLS